MLLEKVASAYILSRKISKKKKKLRKTKEELQGLLRDSEDKDGEKREVLSIEERLYFQSSFGDEILAIRLRRQRAKGSLLATYDRVFHLCLWLLITQVAAQNTCTRGICKTPCDFQGKLILGQMSEKLSVANPMKEICYDAYALEVKEAKYQGLIGCSEANTAADLCLDVQNNKIGTMEYHSTYFKSGESTDIFCWTSYQYCQVKYLNNYEVYRSVFCQYELELPKITGDPQITVNENDIDPSYGYFYLNSSLAYKMQPNLQLGSGRFFVVSNKYKPTYFEDLKICYESRQNGGVCRLSQETIQAVFQQIGMPGGTVAYGKDVTLPVEPLVAQEII
jgi:hypothetical protein